MPHNLHDTLQPLKGGKFYSLPRLGKALGHRLSQTAGAADDNRVAAAQVEHLHHVHLPARGYEG